MTDRELLAALAAPVTKEELKRAWNMIGQQHPQMEWVEGALIAFIERRLAQAAAQLAKGAEK